MLANDEDVDGVLDPSTLFLTMGNLTRSGLASTFRTADFKVGYTVANFTGTDTFTYTVEDNEGTVSNEATVTVIVQ